MTTPADKIALTIREATALTGVSRCSLYLAITSGSLRAKKRGKSTLIRPADLQSWIDCLPDYVTTVDSKAPPAEMDAAHAPAPRKRRLQPRLVAAE